jgi:phosphoribosylformylglycinamidine synthase
MNYTAEINVMLKEGISDPQGQIIERALPALGYSEVSDVRVGKRIQLSLEADTQDEALTRANEMCERLLANTVIESYEVSIDE